MKIWFQKHVTVGKLRALDESYESHARSLVRPETEVVFHGMPKEAYEGSFPNLVVKYLFPEVLFTNYFLSRVIEAERIGYDAFVIGTSPDPGLREARTLVDIPVIGYGEASMHVACMLGSRMSFVGFVHDVQQRHIDNARIYGLSEKMGPMGRVPVPAQVVQDALEGRVGPFLDAFMATARQVIADGADVIIPNEGLTNEIMIQQGISHVDGVPIVDSNGVTFKLAEMMADMRRVCGMSVSRKGYYFARPPKKMVDHLNALYGAP